MAGLGDVAKAAGVKHEEAGKIIAGIKELLKQGEKVTIQDFGTFSLDVQDERESRNPSKPDETFIVPAKMIPKFKFSQSFKNTVAEEIEVDNKMLKAKREFKKKYNEKTNKKPKARNNLS